MRLVKTISIYLIVIFSIINSGEVFAGEPEEHFSKKSSYHSRKDSSIDLLNGKIRNVLILDSPDAENEVSARKIILPKFVNFCHVAADSTKFRWIGASNRMLPWIGGSSLNSIFKPKEPVPPIIPAPNQRAFMMMFKLQNGEFLTLLPLSGNGSVSWLEISEQGDLFVDYGTLGTQPVPNVKVPLIAWYISDNIYESIRKTWEIAIDNSTTKERASLRNKKEYPEEMKYLGWCTWEQYKKDINETVLLDVIDKIEDSEVPVRWFLIDDGHQEDYDKRRLAFSPSKVKFPNGWDPIIARRSEDKIKWIGIWHGFLSHWRGIHEGHSMKSVEPYLMKHTSRDNAFLPKDDKESSEAFYKTFIGTVYDHGFDFMKVDNISRSTIEYYGSANPARTQKFNVLSLEKACFENRLGLMNCSAHNTIDLLNATNSATMRTSPDYKKHNLSSSKSQILQSVFNTCWLGQTLWPDHDMFHSSDDEVNKTMAITKALSGGPIYLSDDPTDFNYDIVSPLCYEDGLLIRPIAPGVPMPESIFNDALYEKNELYKVIAPLKNKSCAIVAYNLTMDNFATLSTKISTEDYRYSSAMIQPYKGKWDVPDEGLIVYDWKEQKGMKLCDDGIQTEIKGFGHQFFILCPIEKGWSVVGRPDKFLSPSTVEILKVEKEKIKIKIQEPGSIVIYSEEGDLKSSQIEFESIGNNFYKGNVNSIIQPNETITINRN